MHVCAQVLGHVRLFATPRSIAHQSPLSMGLSRQEYWSAIPSSRGPSPPRNQTHVSCMAGRSFTHGVTWEALSRLQHSKNTSFICTGASRKLWVTLLQHLFYCSGLNLQHLWGMPVDPAILGFRLLVVHSALPPSGLTVQLITVCINTVCLLA